MLRICYAGDFTQRANSTVGMHQHVWGQLEYIEEGRLLLRAQNQEYRVEAGDAVWLAKECPHEWRALSPVRALSFKLEWSHDETATVITRALDGDAWLQALPRRAMDAWQSADPATRQSANSLLEGLVWTLHTAPEDEGATRVGDDVEAEWRRLMGELNRASGPLLSLDQMARFTHASPAHFRRLFEARYNTTPGRYQLARRMERAQGLLQYTRLPLAQIAGQAGFSDVSAFSKAFMRYSGRRPSELRP